MKITHIGHAGFIVEAAGARILIDPWFNPAFFGSWRPNPDNSHLADEVADGWYEYLYVSHGHEDHCDDAFLDALTHEPLVLCASWMTDTFLDYGLKWTEVQVRRDGLRLEVISDDWRQDSMLLIEAEGQRVLFANDCNLDRCEWPTNIDVLACQYSGACYYPTAYDYPPDVMAEKVAVARAAQMDMLVAKVRACGAKAYIPCAGPAYHHGQIIGPGGPFPVWSEIEAEFKARCPGVEVRTEGLLMAEADVIVRHETVSHEGFYEFRMPAWLHKKVEAGECSFEDALSTYNVHITREPDVFDPKLIYPLRGRAAA